VPSARRRFSCWGTKRVCHISAQHPERNGDVRRSRSRSRPSPGEELLALRLSS
ncbi:unnamed protein product, partial [Ectocarpus sp. 13 AM-2016]